jgi:hypothetical protein
MQYARHAAGTAGRVAERSVALAVVAGDEVLARQHDFHAAIEISGDGLRQAIPATRRSEIARKAAAKRWGEISKLRTSAGNVLLAA